MEIGDIVRLKQPFRPEPDCLEEYHYGIVIGLVEMERESSDRNVKDIKTSEPRQRSQFSEVVLQLYQPETSSVYTDELGSQSMFYFRVDELEL